MKTQKKPGALAPKKTAPAFAADVYSVHITKEAKGILETLVKAHDDFDPATCVGTIASAIIAEGWGEGSKHWIFAAGTKKGGGQAAALKFPPMPFFFSPFTITGGGDELLAVIGKGEE